MSEFESGFVPCDGCVLCCKKDAVRLLPGDDFTRCEIEPHPYMAGDFMIAHKANGDCIYLIESGCSIYEDRPRMCRSMDCRIIAAGMTRKQAKKVGSRDVYDRGIELIVSARRRVKAVENLLKG